MNAKIKKVRSTNFSKEEELLLADEICKEKNVIENKISNKISNIEKDQAWERVQKSFNSKGYVYRSMEQLKSKYVNLKTKARRVIANEKVCVKGTGGGPGCGSFDPIVEAILKLINIKTVVGLQYPMDSDSCFEDYTINIRQSPQHSISDSDPFPVLVINETSNMASLPSSSADMSENIQVVSCVDFQEGTSNTNFQNIIVDTKQAPLEEEKNTPKSTLKRSLDADWSHYVPRKLKEPVSKKLRPTIPTPLGVAKEEYYKLKLEYLRGELEEQKKREERAVKEEKRREEEHTKKMLLLDLEIKKQQLDLAKR